MIAGLQASGAEIALTRLVQQSQAKGLDHVVVSLTGRGDLAGQIESSGARVVTLELGRGPALIPRLMKAFRTIRGLKPDILQGWMTHGNMVAWVARLLLHPEAKLAWNLRMSLKNAVHETRRTMALTRLAARLSRSVDLLVSNSAAGLQDHIDIGYRPRRAIVIPNGYDPDVFRLDRWQRERFRQDWGASAGSVVFGLIGRYHAVKGHDVFINAAALASRERDMVFMLVGRDVTAENDELTELLDRLDVTDRFRLLGARTDIPDLLSGLDVVCIPSVYEGFPNALGEALMTGIPCIATDVSDVRAIMDGAGRLIAVGDVDALARAMIDLHDLGGLGREALGAVARRSMVERYTLRAVTREYARQYEQAVAKRY